MAPLVYHLQVSRLPTLTASSSDVAAPDPVRAFHMPTRWAPRTTQMDRDPSSHPSQENPLKLVLESDSLITPHWKSTSLLPTIPQMHLDTYGLLALFEDGQTLTHIR